MDVVGVAGGMAVTGAVFVMAAALFLCRRSRGFTRARQHEELGTFADEEEEGEEEPSSRRGKSKAAKAAKAAKDLVKRGMRTSGGKTQRLRTSDEEDPDPARSSPHASPRGKPAASVELQPLYDQEEGEPTGLD